MSDLIAVLRGRANKSRDTHPVDAEIDDNAADEIERLRAERLAFATESEERQAEIERLQDALRLIYTWNASGDYQRDLFRMKDFAIAALENDDE